MIDEKYYLVSKEDLGKTDFWTNDLYNKAYDEVKDRKYPIVIPSYNRPENLFLKWVNNTFTYETWPIYVIVRDSQKEQYENSKYVVGKDYIHVTSFEDSLIDDIGKVRKAIVDHFSKTYTCIFMFDDDLTNFGYTVPFKRDSGTKISFAYQPNSPARVFAMWQYAMEKAISIRDDVIMSTGMIAGFNWIDKFCDPEESLRFMSGSNKLAVCLNLTTFKNLNVNYRTIKGNGHDDIDLLIRAILAGATTAEFRWISYGNTGIGTDILKFNSVKERFAFQYQEMYNNFHDIDFVKWIHAHDDKPTSKDNVGINWRKAIKYHNDLNSVNSIDQRIYNLIESNQF